MLLYFLNGIGNSVWSLIPYEKTLFLNFLVKMVVLLVGLGGGKTHLGLKL